MDGPKKHSMFIGLKNSMLQPSNDNKHIHESTDKTNI